MSESADQEASKGAHDAVVMVIPKPKSRVALGYALVAVAATFWGFWPLVLRKAESYGKIPSALESVVALVVTTLVSAVLVLRDRVKVKATARGWGAVAWMGIADALNVLLFFRAYQTTSVAVAVLTHYLTPILVALAAPVVLGERRDPKTARAVFFSFLGLVILLAPWESKGRGGDLVGALFGAGSAVFYASNVLANKRAMGEFSGSEMMLYHGFLAIPFLALFVPREAWTAIDPRALRVLLEGAVVCGAMGGLLFVWGLRVIPASHASTLTLIEPLVAVIVGALFLGEAMGLHSVFGGVLILGGAWMVVRGRAS